MLLFYYVNFVRNYDKLRVHAFVKQKYFVNKNKTEPNPSHTFIETNLVLQLILESQSKINTVMSWSSRKKKRAFFVPFILSEGIFKKFLFYLNL